MELPVPYVAALMGIAVLGALLRCTVTVARIRDIPAWRRFLPLGLFLLTLGTSLLRAVELPALANTVAFPSNLTALALAVGEVRAERRRSARRPFAG
ncbi:hypothetical protein CUT44_26760 [Streptomyces carminius]|uniref:Uncharacterized protein n=1 Tax=Streptomyces carminius TaxID=2665496 RepID=A0A2M8LS19_9ACTN|nr:hypothetical protein [Streptomyces carminius]PJE94761.1 hypothetical protein CUT44_26760 [Streptomyces carminius]